MKIASDRQFLSVIRRLIISLRSFQADSVFCGDITFNQFTILDHIFASGTLEMSELHRLLSVEKSTTTRMVEPLVVKGYIIKLASEHDSRAIKLQLTADGKKIHKEVWGCISGFMVNIENSIPGNKRDDMLKILEMFIKSLDTCCRPGECCVKK